MAQMMKMLLVLLISLSLISVGRARDARYGTIEVDVVQLLRSGKEVSGLSKYFVDREGYRYLFSSEANRAAFKADAKRFEVQLGGACGKMGELSGRGSVKRFAVVNGRFYVFASDGCRENFLKNPEGHLEEDAPRPTGTSDQEKLGRQLMAKAEKWSGIEAAKGRTLEVVFRSTYKSGSQEFPMALIDIFTGQSGFQAISTYYKTTYSDSIIGGDAFSIDSAGAKDPMVPAWKRSLERLRAKKIFYILTHWRDRGSLVLGHPIVNGKAKVTVHLDGVTNYIHVEATTGKIVAHEFPSRDSKGIFGLARCDFTSYSSDGGVTLPSGWTSSMNGNPQPSSNRQGIQIRLK